MYSEELDEKIAAHEAMIIRTSSAEVGEARDIYAYEHVCPFLRSDTLSVALQPSLPVGPPVYSTQHCGSLWGQTLLSQKSRSH